jgi:hypothetical protein
MNWLRFSSLLEDGERPIQPEQFRKARPTNEEVEPECRREFIDEAGYGDPAPHFLRNNPSLASPPRPL